MANDYLMVGGPVNCPHAGENAVKQIMIAGAGYATLNGQGRVLSFGATDVLYQRLFDFGYGIYMAPWDIIKGVIYGVGTKGVEMLFKYKDRSLAKSFRNGFVTGGLLGGTEKVLDRSMELASGQTMYQGETTANALQHETFQGVLVQGGIAGLVNLLLTWAMR